MRKRKKEGKKEKRTKDHHFGEFELFRKTLPTRESGSRNGRHNGNGMMKAEEQSRTEQSRAA